MPFSRTNQWLRNARLSAFRVTAISWTSRGCISATCIRVILSTQLNISTGRGGTWPIAGVVITTVGRSPGTCVTSGSVVLPAAFSCSVARAGLHHGNELSPVRHHQSQPVPAQECGHNSQAAPAPPSRRQDCMACNVAVASGGVAVATATATPATDDVSVGAALAG